MLDEPIHRPYVEEVPIDRGEGKVTRIREALGRGESQATGELLQLVYNELCRLAARHLARESPGQTLQATALVHEAYLRLVGGDPNRIWNGRAHFFAAPADLEPRRRVEALLLAHDTFNRAETPHWRLREHPEQFMQALHGRPDDISAVIQFAEM
jgi:hypothetical protein